MQDTSAPINTNNPQSASTEALQQTASNSLQTAANQSVSALNQLDASGQAIPLAGVSQTGSSQLEQPIAPPTPKTNWPLYGGIGLLVVVFLVVVIYGLRER